MTSTPKSEDEHNSKEDVLHLAEEKLTVTRKQVDDGRVSVNRFTTTHDETVNLLLRHTQADIRRITKNERINTMPEIREENGVLIVPVVEEEVEIIRRLVLREEVHIRQQETTVEFKEQVSLRKQQVKIHREEDEK